MGFIERNLNDHKFADTGIESKWINASLAYAVFKVHIIFKKAICWQNQFCTVGIVGERYQRIFVTLCE